jgi:hypothetical protein
MAADIRMYPFGARSSGIFYAPVYLANKNPDDFLTTTVSSGSTVLTVHQYGVDQAGNSFRLAKPEYVDSNGVKWAVHNGYAYQPGQTPLDGYPVSSGVALFSQNEQLTPTQKFANSMYTRGYGSYDGTQPAGQGLTHWRVVQQSVATYFGIPNARETVLLQYYHGVTVSGRVLDEAGGPMPGVTVGFVDGTGAFHATAVAGPDGSYSVVAPFSQNNDLKLAVLSGGQVVYNRTDPQFQFTPEQAAQGGNLTGIDLHVPFASLTGVAYQDVDGTAGFNATAHKPLAGAQVSAGGKTATTGPDGHYTIADIAAGSQQVKATLAGYSDASQTTLAKAGQSNTLDIAMTVKQSTVTLRFLDNGAPVSQVPMTISGAAARTATTNAQGNATVILAPGAYHVAVDDNLTVNGATQHYVGSADFTVVPGGQPMTVVVNRNP